MKAPANKTAVRLSLKNFSVFAIFFLTYLLFAHILFFDVGYVSYEAEVRSGIAQDLLFGDSVGKSRGKEAIICSLWWTPLPTLLQLPFGFFPPLIKSSFASSILSVLGAALLCYYLHKIFTFFKLRKWLSYSLLIIFALNPWTLFYATNGTSQMLMMACLIAALYYLLVWHSTDKLSGLVLFSLYISLPAVIKHQAIIFTLLSLLTVFLIAVRKKTYVFRKIEGTFFLSISPFIYLLALWFLFNWLVMGDFIYFLKGTYIGPITAPQLTEKTEMLYQSVHPKEILAASKATLYPFIQTFRIIPILPLAVILLIINFIKKRNFFTPFIILVLLSMPLYHIFMQRRNQSFNLIEDAVLAIPLGFIIVAKIVGDIKEPRKIYQYGSITLIILIAMSTVLSPLLIQSNSSEVALQLAAHYPFIKRKDASEEEAEIRKYILDKNEDSKVAVVGFTGYNFIKRARAKKKFIHTINLYLYETMKNTRGKLLYFLIPEPVGIAAFDDINIKFPKLYYGGDAKIKDPRVVADFQFEKKFKNWRLYRVNRIDFPASPAKTTRSGQAHQNVDSTALM